MAEVYWILLLPNNVLISGISHEFTHKEALSLIAPLCIVLIKLKNFICSGRIFGG